MKRKDTPTCCREMKWMKDKLVNGTAEIDSRVSEGVFLVLHGCCVGGCR